MNPILKRMFCLICIMAVMMGCISCRTESEEQEVNIEEKEATKLTVYLTGIPSGSGEEKKVYPSAYAMGLNINFTDYGSTDGNIFYQALLDYEAKSGVHAQVRWFEHESDLALQLEQDVDNDAIPDLVLSGRRCEVDLQKWMREGKLADFSALIEADQTLTEERYYGEIVRAGSLQDRQYVMPYLFNIGGVITAQDVLLQLGVDNIADLDYTEMLEFLTKGSELCQGEVLKEAIAESNGHLMGGMFFPIALESSARSSVVDYNTGELLVSQEEFRTLVRLLEAFIARNMDFQCRLMPRSCSRRKKVKLYFILKFQSFHPMRNRSTIYCFI